MPAGPISFRLEDVRGQRPVLLVFAPSERSPAYENQLAVLADEDVPGRIQTILVIVLAEGTSTADGMRMDESSADELRTAFGVEVDDFLVVLIGADGRERHRDDTPLQPAAIAERLTDGSTGSSP